MPSVSKAQYRFFKALENNPKLAAEKGISEKVVSDFTAGMSKTRFKRLKEKVKKKA